jgi:hypothetical protein
MRRDAQSEPHFLIKRKKKIAARGVNAGDRIEIANEINFWRG